MISLKLSRSSMLGLMEKRSTFLGAIILFRFSLEIGYLYFVSPLFSYSGFILEFSLVKYCESWVLLSVLMYLAVHRLYRPSDFFLLILLLGVMVPLLSLYSLADQSRFTVYVVTLGYLLITIFRTVPYIRLPRVRNAIFISLGIAFCGVLIVTSWFFISGAVANFNLDLARVYEFRRPTGEIINVGYMGYLNIWTMKVFGPFLLAYGLLRKNYILAVLAIMLHVFWFGVTAHKSPLIYPVVILFIWYFFRKSNALSLFPMGYVLVIIGALSVYLLLEEIMTGSLFIRRSFYVIAKNTFDYYAFFGSEQFVYWSDSITNRFIEYPYHIGPAKLIGQWRGTESHVNNTFLSTGYMHAGVWGVVFYAIIVGVLFRVIDSLVTQESPNWFITAILIVPMISLLTSADLPTAMLTHGIAVAMILAFFARSGGGVTVQMVTHEREKRWSSE